MNNKVNIIYGPCFKSYFMGNVVEKLNGSLAGEGAHVRCPVQSGLVLDKSLGDVFARSL